MELFKWLADSVAPMVTTGSGSTVIAAGFCCLTYSYWSVTGSEPGFDVAELAPVERVAP